MKKARSGTNWFFVDEAGDPTQCRKNTPLWLGPVTGRTACRAGFRTQRSDYKLTVFYQSMPWTSMPRIDSLRVGKNITSRITYPGLVMSRGRIV